MAIIEILIKFLLFFATIQTLFAWWIFSEVRRLADLKALEVNILSNFTEEE